MISMPMFFLLFVVPTANIMVLAFLGYQYWQLQKEKKDLKTASDRVKDKELAIDTDFHNAVNNSISQEQKIIGNAADQAKTILTNTQYVAGNAKEEINKALAQMVQKVENDALQASADILAKHNKSLTTLSAGTSDTFQKITKQFEDDMQKQMQDFRTSLLPEMQKEIQDYKSRKFKEAEVKINEIIKKIAQDVFNKSLSLEDHQSLITKSLEKFQKDGIFD